MMLAKKHRRQSKSLRLAVQKLASIAVAFSNTYVLIRVADVHEFGIYVYSMSVVQIVTIVTVFGLPPLVIKHHAKELGSPERFPALGRDTMRFSIIASFGLAVIAMAGVSVFAIHNASVVVAAVWLLPGISFLRLRTAKLQGIGMIHLYQLPEGVLAPALMLSLSIAADNWFEGPLVAHDLIYLQIAAIVITIIYVEIELYRNRAPAVPTPGGDAVAETGIQWTTWSRTAGSTGVATSAQAFNRMADIFFVGTLLSPSVTAYYRVGSQLAQMVAFGLQIVAVILGREFAAKSAQGELKALLPVVRRAAFAASALAALIYFGLVLASGKWLTGLLTGDESRAPYVIALILGAGQLVSVMAGNVGLLLVMSDQQRIASRTMLQSVAINVVLNVVLIKLIGVYGAAIATFIALLYWNIILAAAARRQIGLSTDLIFALLRR